MTPLQKALEKGLIKKTGPDTYRLTKSPELAYSEETFNDLFASFDFEQENPEL